MRIVFMGTPEFAVPCLQALLDHREDMGLEVAAVFTQPDRPKGRGNRLAASPVKKLAEQYGLPVYQPEKIRRESVEDLRALAPDVCVTAAFGQILSQELLDIPPMGNINVHASLLPRHRGSAPIAWAIWQGDEELGVTTMRMAKGIDTGDMLLKAALPRDPRATCGEMTERLSHLGADLLIETLRAMQEGRLTETPRNEAESTYDPMLTKEMGRMDWTKTARELANQVLALNPWPACTVPWGDGRLKLLRAEAAEGSGAPGTVLRADSREGLLIACGQGALRVTQLQAPGGKAMDAKDYLRGHPVETGLKLPAQEE
jgi:methionyl-tRNA formyltransferase